MRRSSNLGMSRRHSNEKSRLASVVAAVFAAVLLGVPRPAPAALPCGEQPELVEMDGAAQMKRDVAEKAGLILQAPPSANLRAFVTAKRRELRQKYAEIDKTALDQYLMWVTCQAISRDPDLVASQKFDEYANLYRLLNEPIAQAAKPE